MSSHFSFEPSFFPKAPKIIFLRFSDHLKIISTKYRRDVRLVKKNLTSLGSFLVTLKRACCRSVTHDRIHLAEYISYTHRGQRELELVNRNNCFIIFFVRRRFILRDTTLVFSFL